MKKILVATHNTGKLKEYRMLLASLNAEFVSLTDLKISVDVEETGQTFEENAIIKAKAYAELSGLPTLADDSGLVVDALNGAPGIYSSRFAGSGATDEERYQKLLDELQGVDEADRSARFCCVVAVALESGETYTRDGVCEGLILQLPVGSHGFGYDPVFYVIGEGCSMAELSPEKKNQISHRADALRKIKPLLDDIFS